jgi:nicotinamide mononucleotide transporter
VIDLSATTLLAQLRATSAAEWIAVAMGIVYVLLIMRRNRWGWAAGGISSLILTVLAARARLPMQAVLQFSYVVASVYGWWRWAPDSAQQRIGMWRLKGHLFAVVLSMGASFALAQLLAREGYSAWPFLDSLVTCLGLFATWLVARVYLENWIYWLVIDAVSIYLFLSQGLVVTALLFCVYLVIAAAGLRSWWFNYQRAAPA